MEGSYTDTIAYASKVSREDLCAQNGQELHRNRNLDNLSHPHKFPLSLLGNQLSNIAEDLYTKQVSITSSFSSKLLAIPKFEIIRVSTYAKE